VFALFFVSFLFAQKEMKIPFVRRNKLKTNSKNNNQ